MSLKADNVTQVDKHVKQRYDLLSIIGKGAYGIVWKAIDKNTHQIVALKKIFGAFRNSTDSQRTYREVTFLRQMKGLPFIVELKDVIRSVNNLDLYVVFELLESDVHSVIHANILQDTHKRYITYQLLCALKYIHSRHLIHRDLKPSNLLINSDSSIKLCDFGLSRTLSEGDICQSVMTEYVSTRWYRSPELIIGSNHYNEGVDMWAVGCIVGELYAGSALFPGTSTLDQMERVVAYTGPPTLSDIRSMRSEFAETMISNLQYSHPRVNLEHKLPSADQDTIDFIKKLLVFNPDERMTVSQALEHPYVAPFRNPDDEIVSSEPLVLGLSDGKRYQTRDYRNKLYKEALSPSFVCEIKPMEKVPITH